jgi:hypothetical protein
MHAKNVYLGLYTEIEIIKSLWTSLFYKANTNQYIFKTT